MEFDSDIVWGIKETTTKNIVIPEGFGIKYDVATTLKEHRCIQTHPSTI